MPSFIVIHVGTRYLSLTTCFAQQRLWTQDNLYVSLADLIGQFRSNCELIKNHVKNSGLKVEDHISLLANDITVIYRMKGSHTVKGI